MKLFGYDITFNKLDNQTLETQTTSPKRGLIVSSSNFYAPVSYNYYLYYKLYRENSDLRQGISKIAQACGSSGYQFLDKSGKVLDNLPFLDFVGYRNEFKILKQKIIRDFHCTGSVFLYKLRNESNKLVGLQVLDPRTMSIKTDEFGDIKFFEQKIGENRIKYAPDEIAYKLSESDPDNEMKGLSIVEAIVLDILLDQEATKTNYYFFKNSAIPSAIIAVKDTELSEDERALLTDSLKRQFSGTENKHKNLVTNGEISVQQLGTPIGEMEFPELRNMSTEKVCAGIGVPKAMLGYTDGVNYSNGENQTNIFIDITIPHWEGILEDLFNQILWDEFGDKYKFEIITDPNIKRKQKIDYLAKAQESGLITTNEARRELGYEPFDIEEANLPLIKNNFILLEDAGLKDVQQ